MNLEIASITKMIKAKIKEATITTIVLLCKFEKVGQVTLFTNSW